MDNNPTENKIDSSSFVSRFIDEVLSVSEDKINIENIKSSFQTALDNTVKEGNRLPYVVKAFSNLYQDGLPTSDRIIRTSRIINLVIKMLSSYQIYRFRNQFIKQDVRGAVLHKTHTDNAKRIHNTACELKGAFLKIAQLFSYRRDLIPKEYGEILENLQDKVKPLPYSIIRRQIYQELGKRPEDIFSDFNEIPIAAASIGQVHEARLRNGQKVAVKIQYPRIDLIVQHDCELIKFIVQEWQDRLPHFDFDSVTHEIVEYILQETDYHLEATNSRRFQEMFMKWDDVIIPKIFPKYSTKRILVMEFIEGENLSVALDKAIIEDRQNGTDNADKIGRIIFKSLIKQVLEDGFFHADPNPANFLITYEDGNPKVGIVDFGCVKSLSWETRQGYADLAMGVLKNDVQTVVKQLKELGFKSQSGDYSHFETVARRMMKIFNPEEDNNLEDMNVQQRYYSFQESVQQNARLSLPQDFVLLGRVFLGFGGIIIKYDFDIDFNKMLMPYIRPYIFKIRRKKGTSGKK